MYRSRVPNAYSTTVLIDAVAGLGLHVDLVTDAIESVRDLGVVGIGQRVFRERQLEEIGTVMESPIVSGWFVRPLFIAVAGCATSGPHVRAGLGHQGIVRPVGAGALERGISIGDPSLLQVNPAQEPLRFAVDDVGTPLAGKDGFKRQLRLGRLDPLRASCVRAASDSGPRPRERPLRSGRSSRPFRMRVDGAARVLERSLDLGRATENRVPPNRAGLPAAARPRPIDRGVASEKKVGPDDRAAPDDPAPLFIAFSQTSTARSGLPARTIVRPTRKRSSGCISDAPSRSL